MASESIYQSKKIPIPVYLSNDTVNVNFIGRLGRELLRITDPKLTYYIEKKFTWYDLKTREQVVNQSLFKRLEASLNSYGLHGLSTLYSFMITKNLQSIFSILKTHEMVLQEIYKTSIGQMTPFSGISSTL